MMEVILSVLNGAKQDILNGIRIPVISITHERLWIRAR